MPTIQLPLAKGLGKDYRNADYVDQLPVNMLATPKEVLNAAGYLRSYPGIEKAADVAGASRGAQFNTVQNLPYRVAGGKLYKGEEIRGDVEGSERVGLAHSTTSHAVSAEGVMTLYRYDGTDKVLDNWPERIVEKEGYTRTVKEWTHTAGNDDFIHFTVDDIDGETTITITPKTAGGSVGTTIDVPEFMWNVTQSQAKPVEGTPYLTDLLVTGTKADGETVKITYTFNPNQPEGAPAESIVDATTFKAVQIVPEVVRVYAQYEIGYTRDICRNRGRYIWVKDGTNTFGVTDLEDESHPDQYRPFYSAESQPDGIQGVAAWRDFVVTFGTTTTEFFSLTGASDSSSPIYVAQPSLMVNKGIAGVFCKCAFGETFAILSHPACGAPSVYTVNSGQAVPIATATIEKIIREYPGGELAKAVMEAVRFDSHELLLIHLPKHVLCYDATASRNGQQWAVLTTGESMGGPHTAIDYIFDSDTITVADKSEPRTGRLRFDSSAQYGTKTEHILYTPLFKADNARIFDFEVESSSGVSQYAEKLFISASVDGVGYGQEKTIPWNAPFDFNRRVVWQRCGRVRKNIGFRIRIVTGAPVSLSACSIRAE
ncbi:packaged DNA stabilization protein [Serratia sp. BFP-2025]|uniref:packaged DNA stabilization protein n=1 Tax=Serratia sp. BFP-2025 TaxID=3433707 RepID=UPI003D7CE863